MADPIAVPTSPQVVTIEELYRQKGEIVTQLEICQSKLQMINGQLQQIFNQQPR